MGNLVNVQEFYDAEEAMAAAGLLEACGFNVVLKNQHHLSVDPALRLALGGHVVAVPEDEAADATELLKNPLGDLSDNAEKCEVCGSYDLKRMRSKNCFSLAFYWLAAIGTGTPFIGYSQNLRCMNCNNIQPYANELTE